MRTLVFASLVLAGGCVAEESLQLSSLDSDVQSQNRISLNRISLNRISLNRISLNGLTSINGANGNGILDTADGRDVFKYLVQCALPDGQTVTVSDSAGNSYSYAGVMGLAPDWYAGTPTASEKRWVSGCLLARTNAYGVSVAISLRGANANLVADADEQAAFSLREASFWGDVFGETLIANACPGPLKLADSQLSTLPLRACSVSADGVTTTCGHAYAGPCESTCTDANGIYTTCAGAAEVVTVFVATPN